MFGGAEPGSRTYRGGECLAETIAGRFLLLFLCLEPFTYSLTRYNKFALHY